MLEILKDAFVGKADGETGSQWVAWAVLELRILLPQL